MRLLVTRPEPDATALKAQLIGMGHEVCIEPLLQVLLHDIDPQEVDLSEAQALVATSRNGVRAIARSVLGPAAVGLPIYTVGPGTAATARALGFGEVLQGPRDAAALVGFVADRADVNNGSLIYLSGETKARDLGGELRRLGFHVQEPVVYSVRPATAFSSGVAARLGAGEIDGVLLLSAETARIYARLILAHGLGAGIRFTHHYCLSREVARGLALAGAQRVSVASQPDLKTILALVARSVSDLP